MGIGGVIIAIWFVAILFGSPETKETAWSMAVYGLLLAVIAAVAVFLIVAANR